MLRNRPKQGMTLVEVLMVVSIIGLLAAFLVPAVNEAMWHRRVALCAGKLRTGIQAFELYRSEEGQYPPDQNVPGDLTVAAMSDYFNYFNIDWWGQTTELGGRWDWDRTYHGFNASLSIWKPTAPEKRLIALDRLLDDGNLATGNFRKVDTQYHYILEP
jgi:prepilin-type N-terminal cleavage/methylation domain-containing protein